MSKLADQLRAVKIHNNHELLMRFGREDDVAIEYICPPPGRLGWCDTHHTKVWSPKKNSKLGQPRHHFNPGTEKDFHGLRRDSFQLAVNWAMETFGHDYVPSPFGGRIPLHVFYKAQSAVKAGQER